MNEAEYDELYHSQWARLVGQVTLVCGNSSEAADCVQEAFVRAWENRRHLDADAGGWVRTAALRVAFSRWRKARNAMTAWTRDHQARGLDVAFLESSHEADAPVWRALGDLPAAQREALVMHHVLDMPVAQVAEVLGVAQGTVKARLSRGRAALAVVLQPDGSHGTDGFLSSSRPDGVAAVTTGPEVAR